MTTVYEDGAIIASLKENGAAIGHIVVRPKAEASTLADLPTDVAVHLWYCASFAATAVFEGLGAQGTNILCYEGDGVELHVLPRAPQDGLNLLWDAQRADPALLEGVAKTIKEEFWYVGKQEAQQEHAPQKPPKPDISPKDTKPRKGPDHRVKHLRRRP